MMENIMQYAHEAGCLNEALPLGNGTLGAVLYGRSGKEKISLNHDTLWSGKLRRFTCPHSIDFYQKAQALILDGKIRLLPALPDAFKEGSVSGLKAKGNITADISWQDGKLTGFTLQSPIGQEVTVATPEGEQRIALMPNLAYRA